MRTTLDLDPDVLMAAKELARGAEPSVGPYFFDHRMIARNLLGSV